MIDIKKLAQGLLDRFGLHNRLRASFLYNCYWSVLDPQVVASIRSEIDFYRNLLQGLQPGNLIFDIGANHGRKTAIFLELGANVVAVDPDERNQETLSQKFLRYRFKRKAVTIVGKAVSDKIGNAEFWVDQPGSGKNTLNRKWVTTLKKNDERFDRFFRFDHSRQVETTTLDELIVEYGRPFFIKIDIEGHEASALRGLNHAVPFLSFEINLPEFRDEGLDCIRLLGQLCPTGVFNLISDLKCGLELSEWLDATPFSEVLRTCSSDCAEVFWKT